MDSGMLSFEEANNLSIIYDELHPEQRNNTDIPLDFGLVSIEENGHWVDIHPNKSCLKIIDKQKWMLTKIKYGI